jgi:hypothetical protein
MKRKYWIESGVAGIVIFVLLIVMFPHFQRAQVKSQAAALQKYVEDVVAYAAEHPNALSKIRGIVSGGGHGPLTKPNIGYIYLYMTEDNFFAKDENFFVAFPEIPPPNWLNSDIDFVATVSYSRKTTEYNSDPFANGGFEEKPSIIAVKAFVGAKKDSPMQRLHGSLYFSDVDEEGYLKFPSYTIPYDSSNGLSSYGEFYADTSNIWPRKKAVVMDPAPPGETDGTIK